MLTRVDYEASVCTRLSQADHVPFKSVSLGDWQPTVADCHRNVDRWVEANPRTAGARGWVAHVSYGTSIGLTAHSVVCEQDGRLFDITPLENEYYRKTMRFIPHIGDDETFFAMVKMGIEIRCPCELNWTLPEL